MVNKVHWLLIYLLFKLIPLDKFYSAAPNVYFLNFSAKKKRNGKIFADFWRFAKFFSWMRKAQSIILALQWLQVNFSWKKLFCGRIKLKVWILKISTMCRLGVVWACFVARQVRACAEPNYTTKLAYFKPFFSWGASLQSSFLDQSSLGLF